jgi:predicted DNA-binding ribbon-helix-helix protein
MGAVRKRSVTINGHRTSYSIEDEFQAVLEEIAARRAMPLARLIAGIDALPRRDGGLSSALRVFALRDALEARAVSSPAIAAMDSAEVRD